MTIYCPRDILPLAALKGLAQGGEFFADTSTGEVTFYRYTWPDFEIQINLLRGAELDGHLEGFLGYAEQIASNKGIPLNGGVRERIRSTKLVLGFVVAPDTLDASRFERLQNIIGAIAYNTGSLVFWEGSILDENAMPLIA